VFERGLCPYDPNFELDLSFLESGFQAVLLFLVALSPGMAIIYMEACERLCPSQIIIVLSHLPYIHESCKTLWWKSIGWAVGYIRLTFHNPPSRKIQMHIPAPAYSTKGWQINERHQHLLSRKLYRRDLKLEN
jgi:hypothetical protein